jgi:hypothetical protein
MVNGTLVEFHRGWMIEVMPLGDGFQNICRSPYGEELGDGKLYLHLSQAQQSAVELIDQFYICYALKQVLREIYDDGNLEFKEWQQLSQSLESQLL